MSFSSRRKKHTPSNSAPAIGLASRSQPVYPWSAHAPLGKPPSPFPRNRHTVSTTATAAGKLYLFGGYADGFPRNDLYVLSTRDFLTTRLSTSGETPSPRFAHGAALTSTFLLVWGGWTDSSSNHDFDDSLYLLNLVSREWTRVVVNGPRPCGRYFHTVTLVGSNLFVFGGRTRERRFNDIWALDVNRLNSNPRWELYEPAPGEGKPLPRWGHVSVTTGDRIIVFGGIDSSHWYNDTWSFDISTRKWTELQCTGSIPTPRRHHVAVLVDDVMYVFGGHAIDGTNLGDLTALNLSTQVWTTFQDMGPSPSGRGFHAMASDGTRVFVLGGALSEGVDVEEAKPIHVLDTKHLDSSKSDSNVRTTQLARKSSAGPEKEIARSEDERLVEVERKLSAILAAQTERDQRMAQLTDGLERKLSVMLATQTERDRRIALQTDGLERKQSAMLATQTERDRRIAQLTDELAQNSALLKQAEANAVEGKKRAELELRELQAKLDKLVLSCDHALEQAQSALQATSRTAEANEWSQRELAEVRAELEASKSELAAVHLRPKDDESGWAKHKAEADASGANTAANLVNTDDDVAMRRLTERVRAVEAEIASLRGNEKSFEMMECRNED